MSLTFACCLYPIQCCIIIFGVKFFKFIWSLTRKYKIHLKNRQYFIQPHGNNLFIIIYFTSHYNTYNHFHISVVYQTAIQNRKRNENFCFWDFPHESFQLNILFNLLWHAMNYMIIFQCKQQNNDEKRQIKKWEKTLIIHELILLHVVEDDDMNWNGSDILPNNEINE